MKLVRIATPGMVRRIRSISFRKMSPEAPRFMRFRTGALACCSGMSMYFTRSRVLRDGVEQFLRDFIRISVKEANPLRLRRLDLREPRQQLRQAVFQSEIFPVAGGILADQIDFPDALAKKPRGFGNHRFKPAAAEIAAILRDHAKSAGMIAALGDLHVGKMARRGQNARRQVVIEIGRGIGNRLVNSFADRDDPVDFVGPDDGIDLGHVFPDIAAVALDQAAGHDQPLRPADFLVLRHLQNRVDGFLLGRIDETAGVDDQDIRLIGMRR